MRNTSFLGLDELVAFGRTSDQMRQPFVDVGGFIVPGDVAAEFIRPGNEGVNNGTEARGQAAEGTEGAGSPPAEAASGTTPHTVGLRMISRELEELLRYHPELEVERDGSSGFPALLVQLPVGLFRGLSVRAQLVLELPLVDRHRLSYPLARCGSSSHLVAPASIAPVGCAFTASASIGRHVPDVRAWAFWMGGPLGGAPVQSHHRYPDSSICACMPGQWILGVHPLVDYVSMCITWIAKALHEQELGFYPGPQHYGPRTRRLRDQRQEFCGCGRLPPKRYGECCRGSDQHLTCWEVAALDALAVMMYRSELDRQRRSFIPASLIGRLARGAGYGPFGRAA